MKLSTFAVAAIAAFSWAPTVVDAVLLVRAVVHPEDSDADHQVCADYQAFLESELSNVVLNVANAELLRTMDLSEEEHGDRGLRRCESSTWCCNNCQGFPRGRCHKYAYPWCAPLRRGLAAATESTTTTTHEIPVAAFGVEDALTLLEPENDNPICAQATVALQDKMVELAHEGVFDKACQAALLEPHKEWKCFDHPHPWSV